MILDPDPDPAVAALLATLLGTVLLLLAVGMWWGWWL